jgi:hypothetical protein
MTSSYFETPIFDIPWRSPWRIDLEARANEPVTRRLVIVEPEPVKKARPKKAERIPCGNACGNLLCNANKAGICLVCIRKALQQKRHVRKICACGKPMNRNNTKGVCAVCYINAKQLANYESLRMCEYDNKGRCQELLASWNRTGLCAWHRPHSGTKAQYKNSSPRMAA